MGITKSSSDDQNGTGNTGGAVFVGEQFTANGLPSWVYEPAEAVERPELKVTDQAAGLLTVDDVAAYLRVSTKTVRRQIAAGHISAIRIGRSIRVSPEEIMRLNGIIYNRVISNKEQYRE